MTTVEALLVLLVVLGWLVAGWSTVVWLRGYPGRVVDRQHRASRPLRLQIIWLVGQLLAVAGGVRLNHYWPLWAVFPGVIVPLFVIGLVAPVFWHNRVVRRASSAD